MSSLRSQPHPRVLDASLLPNALEDRRDGLRRVRRGDGSTDPEQGACLARLCLGRPCAFPLAAGQLTDHDSDHQEQHQLEPLAGVGHRELVERVQEEEVVDDDRGDRREDRRDGPAATATTTTARR